MSGRSRQRATAETTGTWSATSLSLRSSHSRATRHAPVRSYAEVSENEEEEDDDIDELQADQVQRDDDSESDEPSNHSDSDGDIGEPGDRSFHFWQRPSKRSQPADAFSPEAGSSKRRRQPHRRATADFLTGDDAYLSPSSDGAPRTRRKSQAAATTASSSTAPATASASTTAPRASTSSPQNRSSRNGRDRRGPRTPTKKNKTAGGKRDGVRTPIVKREPSPPRSNRPPWATLPYFVLADIFAYGAGPLDTIASVRWLLGVSRTCKGFAEPALRALYRSPPMLTMNMAHNLVDHLAKDPSTTIYDYRQKVKTLSIDVGSLASRVYRGRHLDIPRLVSYCPGLVNLDLYHYKDMPPYREQTENLRWSYPETLFEVLGAVPPQETVESAGGDTQDEGSSSSSNTAVVSAPKAAAPTGVKLRSWRWNQRLMGPNMTLDKMLAIHLSPTFAGLRKLSFVNYQRPSLNARDPEDPAVIEADRQQAEDFTSLLNALPSLTHLSIESSTAANDLILPLMPKTLQHLELINCWDITADQFAEYLVTHGQALRELTLNYNQSLSLSFLSVLGTACPQLQVLRMNLTYYSQHATYNDANPNYETLITPDQVPAWPAGIQVIELEHLRKWEPDAAEVFFKSLVDSAPHMPELRVLAIKAMLDIPWRQRCEMRDRWEATLERVFKRHVSLPKPANSLSYYDKQKKQHDTSPRSKAKARHVDSEPSRRSHRIATHASSPSSRASSKSRGLRTMAPSTRVSYREPDTDEDIPSSDDFNKEDDDEKVEKHGDNEDAEQSEGKMDVEMSGSEGPSARPQKNRPFVHGMCDVVDIRIDNQKPGEIQYRMVDFLDNDDSGSDDEWTGDGVEVNDYAW
ncbi:hypothetical protein SBRCBS47491_007151 [Sporothrix bragantina]|uniref:Leucine rich repeat domain containing protein n=1 Tax=Sporothrix bragantina TaxID=671064 RepID=A0ABP0CD37_9PEZI